MKQGDSTALRGLISRHEKAVERLLLLKKHCQALGFSEWHYRDLKPGTAAVLEESYQEMKQRLEVLTQEGDEDALNGEEKELRRLNQILSIEFAQHLFHRSTELMSVKRTGAEKRDFRMARAVAATVFYRKKGDLELAVKAQLQKKKRRAKQRLQRVPSKKLAVDFGSMTVFGGVVGCVGMICFFNQCHELASSGTALQAAASSQLLPTAAIVITSVGLLLLLAGVIVLSCKRQAKQQKRPKSPSTDRVTVSP